ncbi:MAG TPA: hypothetical protein GXZ49_02705 [Bacteroidetes bacterium]|jgi:hypothetical protein|nr:hypothetical protein [Bacteroidota bacterium]
MRQQILDQITLVLDQRKNFFIREQDIQLYLANHFINSHLFDNVFIEYYVPSSLIPRYPWTDINNIYIDIVLEKNNRFFPIEIKYKTVRQDLPFLVFGQNINVTLGQHGAQNIGCYDFWKDVKRIELFEKTFQSVERGVVLFVSNDSAYQKAPLDPSAGYAPFSIHQGRVIPINSFLDWNDNLAVANGRPGFNIEYAYNINWTPMHIPQHHYVLI